MREFFNLDNPRNAETNDDDDQPGADESDTQVTNNMTQFGCIQQALISFIHCTYCFIMSAIPCTHLYCCCTPFTSCKVPHYTLPELTPLFVGAKRLWWIPPQNKRCIKLMSQPSYSTCQCKIFVLKIKPQWKSAPIVCTCIHFHVNKSLGGACTSQKY